MKRYNPRYYLAYGSNLNVGQMSVRCPNAKIIGTGEIPDYRLMFKGSKTGSFLTIEPCKGKSVPVAVWMVTGYDEERLDRYEGFPIFYYKKEMIIKTRLSWFHSEAYENIKAFVYIMHEDRSHGIPSNVYVKTCLEGYKSFNFDPRILKEAYLYSKNKVEEVKENA